MSQPQRSIRALLALTVLAGAAAPAVSQQRFTESTDVVVVEVPVQVLDKDGQPVRGLTAGDFEVYEGRKKLPVTGFNTVDLYAPGATPASARNVPPAARRHFLMLFDLSNSEPKSIVKARLAARGVLAALRPSDLVAVGTYSSQGPQLILGFTSDRQQIQAALETLGLPQLVDRTPDPLRLTLDRTLDEFATTTRAGLAGGAVEEAILDVARDNARDSDRADRSAQRAALRSMTRSLTDLARMMGNVQGRKYVVYLSEGFDASVLQGTSKADEQNDESLAVESGDIANVDSEKRFGSTSSANAIEAMLESFRRADCVIQAVDIGGLRDAGDPQGQHANGRDSLFQMAHGTGGDLFENFNDLSSAMGKMLERTGVTYVLAVQPENLQMDGAWHKIRVELKQGRGARVVHRDGFYAPRPYTMRSPLEKVLSAADQVMGGTESGSLRVSAMATSFRSGGDKAYVPVVLAVPGSGLLQGFQGPVLPVEIYVYALDETGGVHDYLTQTIGLDVVKVEPALRQNGLKFFGHLELAPGTYSLRALVRNGATGASGLRVVPLEVPAATQAGPALLPPLFPGALGQGLTLREQPHGEQTGAAYPFVLGGQPFLPSPLPSLAPGQELPLAVLGYNLGSGDLKLRFRVLGADGQEVGPAQVTVAGREAAGADGIERLRGTFRAPQLAPGEYQLRLTLTDASGQERSSAARFTLAPAP
jgi:VWFA-related protein